MRMNYEENEQTIDEAIHRLVRILRRKSPSTPRGSHGYIRLLSLINEHDGATSSELAERMDIRPSSLTEMLGYLESDGTIKRNRDDKDMRIIRVFIEDTGREQIKQAKNIVNDQYSDILSQEESIKFIELCNKLSHGLRSRNQSDTDQENNDYHTEHDIKHHHHNHHHSDMVFHKVEKNDGNKDVIVNGKNDDKKDSKIYDKNDDKKDNKINDKNDDKKDNKINDKNDDKKDSKINDKNDGKKDNKINDKNDDKKDSKINDKNDSKEDSKINDKNDDKKDHKVKGKKKDKKSIKKKDKKNGKNNKKNDSKLDKRNHTDVDGNDKV